MFENSCSYKMPYETKKKNNMHRFFRGFRIVCTIPQRMHILYLTCFFFSNNHRFFGQSLTVLLISWTQWRAGVLRFQKPFQADFAHAMPTCRLYDRWIKNTFAICAMIFLSQLVNKYRSFVAVDT